MYVLGINISHHPSSCLIKDGEILYFVEDTKLLRDKYHTYQDYLDDNSEEKSFFPGIDTLKKYTDFVDYVIFSSYGQEKIDKDIIQIIGNNLDENGIKYKSKIFYHENHHIYHAANSFYFSGFEDAVALIMDGGGSYDKDYYHKNIKEKYKYAFRESESIYKCDYNYGFTPLFKHYSLFDKHYQDGEVFVVSKETPYKEFFTHSISCGTYYSLLVELFGTGEESQGKIMGLSSYGSEDPRENIFLNDDLFYEHNGEWITDPYPDHVILEIMDSVGLNTESNVEFNELFPNCNDYIRHLNNSIRDDDIRNLNNINDDDTNFKYNKFKQYANIAKKCQIETERQTIRLIQRALDLSGSKNIVLSGGYFLNCVNNFNYLKYFPDVNFFVDPIANDAGTAIGAARWFYHGLTGDKIKRPLETLYLGE